MAYYLLNQNMRTYGGRAAFRTNAYLGTVPMPAVRPVTWGAAPRANGFAPLVGGLPGGSTVCAAGLTEITNMGISLPAVLRIFTTIFGVAPATAAVIQSTLTAFGRMEFVALAVNGVLPRAIGRAMIVPGDTPICQEDPVAAPPPAFLRPAWRNTLPAGPLLRAALDYQGIVYVKVQLPGGGPTIAVCFVHNSNTLTPVTFMQAMPRALQEITTTGVRVSRLYLGGDFNVAPPLGSVGGRTLQVWPYFAPIGVPVFPGAFPNGTTFRGSPIDFWFTDSNPAVPTPLIAGGINRPIPTAHTNTMDYNARAGGAGVLKGWMSDHAAIALQIT